MSVIIDLNTQADLAQVGGKALNLIRLNRAGFDVPAGFVVSTTGYHDYVRVNALEPVLTQALAELDRDETFDSAAAEQVSQRIRAAFQTGVVPDELRDAVGQAVRRLATETGTSPDELSVAVRSSATAEDLPGLSFAGQQDSYLNVIGPTKILEHIVQCWSSLWTDRAISYRRSHPELRRDETLGLAVVVQRLVPAEVSGVMFTANPLTGARNDIVIEATAGLGEALVSGQVEPDSLVLDSATGRVLQEQIGAKAVRADPTPGGGITLADNGADSSTTGVLRVTDRAARSALLQLARRINAEYAEPQDVEWAIADGRLWVLQSRPITTLYPVPTPLGRLASPAEELAVWFSVGAFQGVLAPITPLGRDGLAEIASGAAAMLGRRPDRDRLWYLGEAGERLWARLDLLLRHPLGRRLAPVLLGIAEPASRQTVVDLLREPVLSPRRPSLSSVRALATLARTVLPRLLFTLRDPVRGRQRFDRTAADLVRECTLRQQQADAVTDPQARLQARVAAARQNLGAALRVMFPAFAPLMLPSVVLLAGLRRFCGQTVGDPQRALDLLRGLSGNVTTEMDLALWQVAQEISSAGETELVQSVSGHDQLPVEARRALDAFLQRYGMRGVAEIDLGRPRWRENPDALLDSLRGQLSITDPHLAPDVVHARSVRQAEATAEELRRLAPRPLRPFVRFATSRVRALLGARETPKFTIVQIIGVVRQSLLTAGRELAEEDWLDDPEDIAYLHLDELASTEDRCRWRQLVQQRRQASEQEAARRAIPRLICSDGRAFFGGLAEAHGDSREAIVGTGVSAGVVEARVRVVEHPHGARLVSGEIMVCAGTDPAWTPLFLVAAGLITEVGGMMTHGSVVAREYGIPAVVGVPEATQRLRTGDRVRLDGSTGRIEVLEQQ